MTKSLKSVAQPNQTLKPRTRKSLWLALFGAVAGTAGYYYLTKTENGQRIVKHTKNQIDGYLAQVENTLAQAQYRAEYQENM